MSKAYIIFTKIPTPGFVKTRLIPDYSKQQAADIQNKMLRNILQMSQNLKDIKIFFAYYSENELVTQMFLNQLPKNIHCFSQSTGSIGTKMSAAVEQVKELGFDQIILTGSDIPRLTSQIINDAFSKLNEQIVVIGPTSDGGYYLFGINSQIDQRKFLSVPIRWSTDTVFAATIAFIKKSNFSVATVASLSDVDFSNDWKREARYAE